MILYLILNTFDEEIYFVFDELKELFPKEDISFMTVSHCVGIIQLRKSP